MACWWDRRWWRHRKRQPTIRRRREFTCRTSLRGSRHGRRPVEGGASGDCQGRETPPRSAKVHPSVRCRHHQFGRRNRARCRPNASASISRRVVERPRPPRWVRARRPSARPQPGLWCASTRPSEHRQTLYLDSVARGEEGRGRGAVGHVDDLVAALSRPGRPAARPAPHHREGRGAAAALGPGPLVVATDPAASRSTFRASLSNAFSSTALNFSAGARACFALSPRFASQRARVHPSRLAAGGDVR